MFPNKWHSAEGIPVTCQCDMTAAAAPSDFAANQPVNIKSDVTDHWMYRAKYPLMHCCC